MRIAFLGIRGIPANYGGFETFTEQVGVRLAERGHDVTVYCRSKHYNERRESYRGVALVSLPSVHTKHLDSVSHTFLATLHLVWRGADIAYYCSSGNSPFSFMPRLRGAKVLLNTDGLEWERDKWRGFAKAYFKIAEHFAARFPNLPVADSRVIQEYYRKKFGRETAYVAYGTDVVARGTGRKLLGGLGVEPERYFLFVSRLEPENNAHVVVKAFEGVRTDMKLLIVGSAPFAGEYIQRLHGTRDERILFPGGLYGEVYQALRANAYVYVNAIQVGGTHPAILEAMGAGNCVLVSDISYNVETIAGAGLTFRNKDAEDLRDRMQMLVDRPEEVERCRALAVERVARDCNWDRITDEYEAIFADLTRN